MNIFLYMNHTPSGFTINDDYFTPRQAFEDIAHLIPTNKTVYEPFVGSSRSGEFLQELLPNNIVIYNKEVDFFHNTFQYDLVVSNPPFSIAKQILTRLKELNKPFILLLPASRLCTQYIRKLFKKNIQIIIPKTRINFINNNNKRACNFDCFWYCYKINLPRDINWL